MEKRRPRDGTSGGARQLRVARDPPPPRAQSKSQFESVPQDTEESESLDLVDFRGTASSVETVV